MTHKWFANHDSNQKGCYSVSQIGEVQNQKPIAIWSKSLGVFHLSEKRYTNFH